MLLPGRIPPAACLVPPGHGLIQCAFDRGEPVVGGVELGLGLLSRGLGLGERLLGGIQPAAQVRQLPDRLPAFPRPAPHVTIIPGEHVPPRPRSRSLRLLPVRIVPGHPTSSTRHCGPK